MGDNKIEQIYPLNNDSVEAKRLNYQHELIRAYCSEELLHPSIAKDDLEAIADIATGTGIWLDDVAKVLDKVPTKSGNERTYDGFDISAAIFPPAPRKGMSFHVQNMFEPFPAEFHGKYNLVHLRLVVGATKEDTHKHIADNILPLLKPGGYIQWDDIYWPCQFFNSNPDLDTKDTEQAIADLKSTDESVMDFIRLTQISCTLPDLVEDYFKELGLDAITKHEYAAPDTPERIAASREFRLEITEALRPVFLRIGRVKTEEEAATLVKKDIDTCKKYFAQGWYSTMPVVTVVGRKGQ